MEIMRLIDADKLLDELQEQHDFCCDEGDSAEVVRTVSRCMKIVQKAPEASKESFWQTDRYVSDPYEHVLFRCASCKVGVRVQGQELIRYKFCPGCGAKMSNSNMLMNDTQKYMVMKQRKMIMKIQEGKE